MKKKSAIIVLAAIMTFSMLSVPALAADTQTSAGAAAESSTEQSAAAGSSSAVNTPGNISITDITYNSVRLTWNSVSGAAGYTIYGSNSENGTYTVLGRTGAGRTDYTADKLTTGKAVYFKILVAYNSGAAASATDGEMLAGIKAVAATPQLDKASVSGYAKSRITVRVEWSRVAGSQGYTLYKYSDSSDSYQKVKTLGQNTTGYTQKKLKAGKTYHYVVKAYRNNDGITAATSSSDTAVKTPKKLTMKTAGFWKTNAGKVIKKARSKRGTPYVWGSSGPNTFDCSGFTCWTMKKVGKKVTGVSLKRTSSRGLYKRYNSKYGLGRDLSVAQPGDIIIMGHGGSSSSIFHVGMYYDGGRYIHATTGGRGVTISKIPASMVVAIIRLPGLE